MKMVKNLMILAFASSFMFASGVGFHMANNYTDLDGANGPTSIVSYGATYKLNDQTSVGFDSELGMMMHFSAPAGTSLRLGWVADTNLGDDTDLTAAKTSLGLGFNWWTGGEGLKTSINTNFDYIMQGSTNDSNLSVVIVFGL